MISNKLILIVLSFIVSSLNLTFAQWDYKMGLLRLLAESKNCFLVIPYEEENHNVVLFGNGGDYADLTILQSLETITQFLENELSMELYGNYNQLGAAGSFKNGLIYSSIVESETIQFYTSEDDTGQLVSVGIKSSTTGKYCSVNTISAWFYTSAAILNSPTCYTFSDESVETCLTTGSIYN